MSIVKGNLFIYQSEDFIYNDANLRIVEGLNNFKEETIYEQDMMIIILCDAGKVRLKIDGKETCISRGDIIICPTGVRVGNFEEVEECSVKLMAIKFSKIHRSIKGNSIWSTMMYARNNPVFHLNERDLNLTEAYYYVIRQKVCTERDFYYNEIMDSLLHCAFYELCVVINRQIAPGDHDKNLNRQDLIFKQFMELLSMSDCKNRSVSSFAKTLCITPKYLSSIVREISGKTALEMILENATEVICHELEYSDKSIKEIADKYNFPNISVFGKFIKSRVGKSPRAFRKQGANVLSGTEEE